MTVHWVFDDLDRLLTMTSCPHTVVGDRMELVSGRFPIGNMFHYWKNNWWNRADHVWSYGGVADRPQRYAYNIGTWNDHGYWTGCDGNPHGFTNFLNHVHPLVLEDARNGRARLVIDNLNEGFYDEAFYEFMHRSMARYGLPGASVMWLTGNEHDDRGYQAWCDRHGIRDRFSVVAFCHLMYMQQINLAYRKAPTWDDHLARKALRRSMRGFNCLNRVSRNHRELFVMLLIERGLHRNAAVSHGPIRYHGWTQHGIPQEVIDGANALLPLVVDDPDFDHNKAMHINTDIYLDTWASVITETHAFDEDHNLFISEKLWKPIWALQPFMVLGHAGTLDRLRRWGYETFGMLWDEGYDLMPFNDRVTSLLNNLQTMELIRDRHGWLEQAREVCLHNQRRFLSMDWFQQPEHKRFMAAYTRDA